MAITISGSGIVEANIANGAVSSDKLATGIDATKLADGTITNSELQYINTLASNAQTQISAAGGAWTFISSQTASTSATIDFTADITSSYSTYMFTLTDVVPETDDVNFWMRTSTDAGSTWDSSAGNYSYANMAKQDTNQDHGGSSDSATQIVILSQAVANGSDTNEESSSVIYMHNPSGTTYTKFTQHSVTTESAGELTIVSGAGRRLSAADVTGVRFLAASGNIESGTFKLYGLTGS